MWAAATAQTLTGDDDNDCEFVTKCFRLLGLVTFVDAAECRKYLSCLLALLSEVFHHKALTFLSIIFVIAEHVVPLPELLPLLPPIPPPLPVPPALIVMPVLSVLPVLTVLTVMPVLLCGVHAMAVLHALCLCLRPSASVCVCFSVFESYVKAGRSPQESLMILVPEAYAGNPKLRNSPDVQAFYEYYEALQVRLPCLTFINCFLVP